MWQMVLWVVNGLQCSNIQLVDGWLVKKYDATFSINQTEN